MMPWVKLDEGFTEHPKVLAVGGDAGWLMVCAIAYCNRNLTDGFIPEHILTRLSDRRRPHLLAAKLVAARLWQPVDDGWQIHDFLQYQTSKAKVEEERLRARERMARIRGAPPPDSEDVRPNNSVRSPYPSPSPVSNPVSQSSGDSGNGDRHDDDDFRRTIEILVEHKAAEHPPRSRTRWEQTTVPNTIAEEGAQVRALLAEGLTPVAIAGQILNSPASAEAAESKLPT